MYSLLITLWPWRDGFSLAGYGSKESAVGKKPKARAVAVRFTLAGTVIGASVWASLSLAILSV